MCAGVLKRLAEIGDFGLDRVAAEIAYRADRLWRPHIADRLAGGELLLHDAAEYRIAQSIGAGAALPRAAKPAHPMTDVQKKAFALLFAVIGDVDAGFGLLFDDLAQGLLPQPVEFGRIDRFAARPANMQPGQLRRAAAGCRYGWSESVVRCGASSLSSSIIQQVVQLSGGERGPVRC